MKQAALNLMRVTGAFSMLRLINRGRALILTYHRFSQEEDGVSTSASAFAEQLAFLAAHYRVVPLAELVEQLNGPGAKSSRLAAITIDDGYRDAYEIAYPLLRRAGLPATVFVVTEFLDGRIWLWTDKLRFLALGAPAQQLSATINGYRLRLPLGDRASRLQAAAAVNAQLKELSDEEKEEAIKLIAESLGVTVPQTPPSELSAISWQQAREMDAHGVSIGSHTLTHPILTQINGPRLRRELQDSRLRLEEALQHPVQQFCYPNGGLNAQVRAEVERAGYTSAVSCETGLNRSGADPLTLRRVHADDDLSHFIQSTCGFEEVKDTVRAYLHPSSQTSPSAETRIS